MESDQHGIRWRPLGRSERCTRRARRPRGRPRLHRHAHRILSDVDLLTADLSDYASGLVGVVRLWANTSAVTQFLPNDLAAFSAANPGIRIEFEEGDSREIVVAVLDGEMTVKRLRITPQGVVLQAENPEYPDIHVGEWGALSVWAVAETCIHRL